MAFHISPKASSSRVNYHDVRSEQLATYTPTHGTQGIGERNNVDPSGKLWSLYVGEAEPYDKALVERWKGSMDGILIFAGLFSASVTAFIIESYKMLQQTSSDSTVILLIQISHQLNAMNNGSQIAIPSPPINQAPFRPTSSALRVNALWFLSLGFGLACALSATLVEQWARNYLQAVQRRPAPHKRARISSYLYTGLEKFGMGKVAGAIPTLLHISLFLFFAGLVEFLFTVNSIIAYLTLSVFLVCAGLYAVVTVLPLVYTNCPYQTPLSEYIWRGFQPFQTKRPPNTSMERACEVDAMLASKARDRRDFDSLKWTLESLTEDFEFQPFVEGIPGFLRSKSETDFHGLTVITNLLQDPSVGLANRIKLLLRTCVDSHTISSNLRRARAITCMDAIWSITIKTCQADPSVSADWNLWCHENLAILVKKLKSDSDAFIANSAFNTSTVLVHQLLYDYSIIPRVTEHDLERLLQHVYSAEVDSAQELCSQLKYNLLTAGAKGLEALEAADCLICKEVKERLSYLKQDLVPALDNATTELESYLVFPRSVRSSTHATAAIAMPRVGSKPPPIKTREAMQLLTQLGDALSEIRFTLVTDFVSKLLEKTSLSEKAIDTLGLVMYDLPGRFSSLQSQTRLVDCLNRLIEHDRSLGPKGIMAPAIELLLDIVYHLDEEELIPRAESIARSYFETHPRSRAAYEALVALQKFSSS